MFHALSPQRPDFPRSRSPNPEITIVVETDFAFPKHIYTMRISVFSSAVSVALSSVWSGLVNAADPYEPSPVTLTGILDA